MTKEEIRALVREEIAEAFQAFRRETEHYDGGEIKDMAADMLSSVLDGTVQRLTCKHEYTRVWGPRCVKCSEPERVPDNPFKEEG